MKKLSQKTKKTIYIVVGAVIVLALVWYGLSKWPSNKMALGAATDSTAVEQLDSTAVDTTDSAALVVEEVPACPCDGIDCACEENCTCKTDADCNDCPGC